MLQRYKLRLGDGTVLGVDHQGLRTWALDGKAMVQAADSHEWYPLREFLAAEYVAARRAARQRAKSSDALPAGTPRPLPLVYPTPREGKAPAQPAPVPSELPPLIAEPLEIAEAPALVAEPPVAEVVAEESDTPALAEDPPVEDAPVEEVVGTEPVVAQAFAEDPVEAPILAEELTAGVAEDAEHSWIPDDAIAALPSSLHDREEAEPIAAPFSRGDAAEPVFFEAPLPGGESDSPPTLEEDFPSIAQGALADGASPVAGAPSTAAPPEPPEAVVPIPPPRLQPVADDLSAGHTRATKDAWRPDDELPIIPLKPLDEAPAAVGLGAYEGRPDEIEDAPRRSAIPETLIRWFVRGISAYDALLTGWINRLERRPGSAPTGAPAPEAADAAASIPLAPPVGVLPNVGVLAEEPTVPRPESIPLKAPPPIRDLPTLRLADTHESEEVGEVYGGESRLDVTWRWSKRVLVTTALVAGGLFAVLRWETWVPKAEVMGRAVFTRIERIKESRERRERQREALQEATERLPHLGPQTLQLLIDSSSASVPDPPEIFRLASDAADRGARALTPAEVRELKRLRGELLAALRPSERERVREYDAARARRLVFPFEGRDVLELFERGAYALPQEDRERLQELLGKAIAAGLAVGPDATPGVRAQP